MIQLVEEFLLKKAAQCRQAVLPIERVAQKMLNPAAYHQLDQLANDACLSVRQFERKFRERVGVAQSCSPGLPDSGKPINSAKSARIDLGSILPIPVSMTTPII